MREKQQADGSTVLTGDRETPFKSNVRLLLTQDEFNGVRAFIRELKPGVYVKCGRCQKMKYTSTHYLSGETVLCEECANA